MGIRLAFSSISYAEPLGLLNHTFPLWLSHFSDFSTRIRSPPLRMVPRAAAEGPAHPPLVAILCHQSLRSRAGPLLSLNCFFFCHPSQQPMTLRPLLEWSPPACIFLELAISISDRTGDLYFRGFESTIHDGNSSLQLIRKS